MAPAGDKAAKAEATPSEPHRVAHKAPVKKQVEAATRAKVTNAVMRVPTGHKLTNADGTVVHIHEDTFSTEAPIGGYFEDADGNPHDAWGNSLAGGTITAGGGAVTADMLADELGPQHPMTLRARMAEQRLRLAPAEETKPEGEGDGKPDPKPSVSVKVPSEGNKE